MIRKILCVGGTSGVGREVVRRLSESGDGVIAAVRDPRKLPDLPHVRGIRWDATSGDPLENLPETLDGLVYCPGSILLKPFRQISEEDFRRDLEINFLGAVRAVQRARPSLERSERASIVLFSTVAVQTGLPYHASVASAKGAIEGLVRSLAAEFAPRVRVNALALSLTDTPLASSLLGTEEKRRASENRHPLKRIGKPEEVAGAVEFLLGEESGFMTGQILKMDGGLSSVKLL